LDEAFDIVPLSTGFDIEIKYPSNEQLQKGKVTEYPERNQIVDAVLKVLMALLLYRPSSTNCFFLKVVFNHAKSERSFIYFSSFDPDICTMLSLKRNYSNFQQFRETLPHSFFQNLCSNRAPIPSVLSNSSWLQAVLGQQEKFYTPSNSLCKVQFRIPLQVPLWCQIALFSYLAKKISFFVRPRGGCTASVG